MTPRTKLISFAAIVLVLTVTISGIYLGSLQGGKAETQTSSAFTLTHSTSNATTGTLAVLLTDPSSIPLNVTAVYISLSDLQLHPTSLGNSSGWLDLGSAREINLLSIVNSTETVSGGNISDGSYDALRVNLTAPVVTYEGQNFSANLISHADYLSIPIQGGITISGGQVSGALVEMTPTLLSVGNATNPSFAFFPAAKGHVLPSLGISSHPRPGNRSDYSGSLKSITRDLTHFQVNSAILNTSLLNLTVQNTGSDRIDFKIIAVSSVSAVGGGWVPTSSLGSVGKNSEYFGILANGTLLPLTTNSNRVLLHDLTLAGYSLAPHQSATFTYTGPITMGALKLLQDNAPGTQLSFGQSCTVPILGSPKYVQAPVTVGAAAISNSTLTTSSS